MKSKKISKKVPSLEEQKVQQIYDYINLSGIRKSSLEIYIKSLNKKRC